MTNRKVRAGVPKIEGFERINYQDLALTGLTGRVYSAYFGKPKRIIDAYDILYCRGKAKKPSTGRISHATKLLVKANYLDLYKIERSNWPLLGANLEPLFSMFQKRKIKLNEKDRQTLEKALIATPGLSERFVITEDEASGEAEFVPSPLKMKQYLNSAATLSLISLFKQGAPEFKEERELLRRIKQKAYGATDKAESAAADLGNISDFTADLVLDTRVSLKGGEDLSNMLLFKLVWLNHEPTEAEEIEKETLLLFQ